MFQPVTVIYNDGNVQNIAFLNKNGEIYQIATKRAFFEDQFNGIC
jgi:hypothetical protein